MAGYYDAVLGLIPLVLAGVTGGLTLGGFALPTAVALASVAALALIGHAMFVRAPVDPPTTRSASESFEPAD